MGDMSDEHHISDLVVPFVTVMSNGGPHEDAAYVAGYEVGAVSERMRVITGLGVVGEWAELVHVENIDQLDLMAMGLGWKMLIEGDPTPVPPEGWAYVLFAKFADG